MTKGGGNLKQVKRTSGKKNFGLLSILEQNSRQLKIMNDRIRFLETGGRASSSYNGHYVGDNAGKNYNNMTISTPLIDKNFPTQSNVKAATQQNRYNVTNNESSQFSPMVMAPQHLFYTPQGQPYYAQPTPSPSPNNWLATNTPQGIMYQQQAFRQEGYNNESNNMLNYALLDCLAFNKRKY